MSDHNRFIKYGDVIPSASQTDHCQYLERRNVRIYPKELIFTNPFEGKIYTAYITIRNCGKNPVILRILKPTSYGIKMKTLLQGLFLCSGMSVRRRVTYKVQMMTLLHSCIIPIYINDYHFDYQIMITNTQVVLKFKPDTLLDFGMIDASSTPIKRKLTVINCDEKPTRFSIDLGPNDLQLDVEPSRGIIMGEDEIQLTVTGTFPIVGEFNTEFWVISVAPTYIPIKVVVVQPQIIPKYVPQTPSFTFIQFPITYYGTKSVRNVIMSNNSIMQSFFCVLGEVEMQTYTLKQLRKEVDDYKYFKISPEEGRLLPNDVRVFQLTYTPVKHRQMEKAHHLVMMRIKRLQCKDLNINDYEDGVFEKPPDLVSNTPKTSKLSTMSEECVSNSIVEVKASHTTGNVTSDEIAVRLMLYSQVEEVQVTLLPDELNLIDLEVNVTVTRVLQIQNNCSTLPIIFRYQKIAFIDIIPKQAQLEPLEFLEITVYITPRSYDRIKGHIKFDLLYHDVPRGANEDLKKVGSCKIPFSMDEKITTKPVKSLEPLAKNFAFIKPNQAPNPAIMNILMQSDIYLGLPDDRPRSNKPDFERRMFKTIYAAIPRYQPVFNEYALTPRDKRMLKIKNYYNMYIHMMANKEKRLASASSITHTNIKCIKPIGEPETYKTVEFVPLTALQLVSIGVEPRSIVVENVAYNSTYNHTLTITNKTNSFLRIYLKGRKESFLFHDGQRFTMPPDTEKQLRFMIYIDNKPFHNYDLDVVINNCFVFETTVFVKASPKHLTLSMDIMTFYENEPPSKYVELHNELNVNIPFEWKVPSVFKVDPIEGEVVSGRFVACMVTFEVGLAENMVYDLGIHTENKFYNLKVLIEGTDYKVKIPKVLNFEELSLNVPAYKIVPVTNCSLQSLTYKVHDETLPDGFSVNPKEGNINPWSSVLLVVCANRNQIGYFKVLIELMIVQSKKITCEAVGTVIFPELCFNPETLRFRKMAASSFDIACVSVTNKSNALAVVQFDTERFPEFSYSEYTNSEYMSNKDVLFVNPQEVKQFSIHFYPFNPLVTSFPLPIIINKIGIGYKSKTSLTVRPSVKVHAQVLSYKLEVKSWRYQFVYFPYFAHKNVTSHLITIKNPCKTLLTFCIRLDELEAPFSFNYVKGVKTLDYECSIVVELQPDEYVVFEAKFQPKSPGSHSIRLPVYIRDDFSQDVHNYFYFVGTFPESTYKCSEESIHLGFIPLSFTISKRIVVDLAYHHPGCNCSAMIDDLHSYVEIDAVKPKSITFFKIVSIIFNSSRTHLLNSKLKLVCDCPGNNFEIDVYGGCENNYFTVHGCIQYFKCTSTMSLTAIFDPEDEPVFTSTITIHDSEREDGFKHIYKTDLPYFQSGSDPFDQYMQQIVSIFEKWLTEQVFFGVKSFTIPDTICMPDIREYEKQGKKEAIIKLPIQQVMNYLLGHQIVSRYEIKFSEKKPNAYQIRKFYRDFLSYLCGLDCFVNMIQPEHLLPYDMYKEYMTFVDRHEKLLSAKMFFLLSKQNWLDLLMQSYKILVFRRLRNVCSTLTIKTMSLANTNTSVSIDEMGMTQKHVGFNINSMTVYSEEAVVLLKWINKHFQDQKQTLASSRYNNTMTESLLRQQIENFDNDICDSLGIISCLLAHCPFLEKCINGIYAPASNRMEKFNNAYILIKMLSFLQISFKLHPIDIIEPNTVNMMMFLTYLYDFLLPLRFKDTITFTASLSQSKEEVITILNDSRHKIFYKIFFFDNTDDLFSVQESQISVDVDTPIKFKINYCAKFLRIQKTVMLLSGEIAGYQYTNSKVYYLEGNPELTTTCVPPIDLRSPIYKTIQVTFDIQSPYITPCTYEIFLINDESTDINTMLDSLIPYASILQTTTLLRLKLSSAIVEADLTGKITLNGDMCNIINTPQTLWIIFRDKATGDFMAKINISTKPMKNFVALELTLQKSFSEFPCTCLRKIADVNNAKCPRNIKVYIPSKNDFLWTSVMHYFLDGRDPEESEFWSIYGNTPIGSHIVERLLYDHKRFLLTDDMTYFMNKTFTYYVKTKTPEYVLTQDKKVITEAAMTSKTTEILVHLNKNVKSFYLILESLDGKETRTYKVLVNYQ